jgi:hypothetical protein
MGICLAVLLFINNLPDFTLVPLAVGFGILYGLTEKFGWGEPLGSALFGYPMNPKQLEKWQVGPLKKNAYLALVARGGIWASPALALVPYYEQFLFIFIAMGIAMPVSVLIARFIGEYRSLTNKAVWRLNEYIRGGLVASLTFVFGL